MDKAAHKRSLKDWLQKLFALYKDIARINKNTPKLKITGEELNDKNERQFIVQVSWTKASYKSTPSALVNDPSRFSEFNQLDQQRILIAADECKYRITAQTFDTDKDKALFTVESVVGSEKYFKQMTAIEIFENKKLLHKLSKRDVAIVAYQMGVEKKQ